MEKFYIVQNETKKGPYVLNELVGMDLSEDTLVWKKGLKDWIKLNDLEEIQGSVSPSIAEKSEEINIESKVQKNSIPDEGQEIRSSLLQTAGEISLKRNWVKFVVCLVIGFTMLIAGIIAF